MIKSLFISLAIFLTATSYAKDNLPVVGPLSSLLFYSEFQIEEMDYKLGIQTKEKNLHDISYSKKDLKKLWQKLKDKLFSSCHDMDRLGQGELLLDQALECLEQNDCIAAKDLFVQASEVLRGMWYEKNGLTVISDHALGKACSLKKMKGVAKKEKKALKPYLIPQNHPFKKTLDSIFTASRALQDDTAFTDAGFNILFSRPRSFIKVASHPLLPSYLVKVYLDNELRQKKGRPYWTWWVKRCQGATQISKVIKKKKIKGFSVAKKWIYLLPSEPKAPALPGFSAKNSILLVQDMQPVSKGENHQAWKTKITRKHLNELYAIISLASGSNYHANNIPYTKSGTFAFLDTEYPDRKPDFYSVRINLSPEMLAYWDKLVKNGGK